MSNKIHPSAIVDPKAEIGKNVEIGPFSIIGPQVKLADNVVIHSHVVITGITSIGEGTVIFPFASLGHVTQDKKYKGEASELIIGKNNTIREYVTMHGGTEQGGNKTIVGDNNLFMIGTHIAHDCIVGSNCIFANMATLAGHVTVEDFAILGGLSAVHQYVRIGQHAMVGGMSAVEGDVIPYGAVKGERASLNGFNIIGLKRRGFDKAEINAINQAYDTLFTESNMVFSERINQLRTNSSSSDSVKILVDFLSQDTSRPICKPKKEHAK